MGKVFRDLPWRSCLPTISPRASALPPLAACEDDDGDLAGGQLLVAVELRVGDGEALVQDSALRFLSDDRDGLEGLVPRLDGNARAAARL
jgi:hypothetical protein